MEGLESQETQRLINLRCKASNQTNSKIMLLKLPVFLSLTQKIITNKKLQIYKNRTKDSD